MPPRDPFYSRLTRLRRLLQLLRRTPPRSHLPVQRRTPPQWRPPVQRHCMRCHALLPTGDIGQLCVQCRTLRPGNVT